MNSLHSFPSELILISRLAQFVCPYIVTLEVLKDSDKICILRYKCEAKLTVVCVCQILHSFCMKSNRN